MITDRQKAAIDKWRSMKLKGKKKFVFRTGFLMYGMTTFIVYISASLAVDSIFNKDFNLSEYISSKEFLQRLLSTFILFGLMGWFAGRSIWRSYQRKWEEASKF